MIKRLKILCMRNDTNFSQVEKNLDFANGSLAKSKPDTISAIRLKKIADYFHVTMEFLLTGESEINTVDSDFSSEEVALIKAYRMCSEDTKNAVAAVLGVKRQDTYSKLLNNIG